MSTIISIYFKYDMFCVDCRAFVWWSEASSTEPRTLTLDLPASALLFSLFQLQVSGLGFHCVSGRKEGHVLINDALNTLFIYTYMLKDHSVREKTCSCHMGYSLPHVIFFYMHHPTDRLTHIMAFVIPLVAYIIYLADYVYEKYLAAKQSNLWYSGMFIFLIFSLIPASCPQLV